MIGWGDGKSGVMGDKWDAGKCDPSLERPRTWKERTVNERIKELPKGEDGTFTELQFSHCISLVLNIASHFND